MNTLREILFRGKRTDNGEWAYGVPTQDNKGSHFLVRGIIKCSECGLNNCREAKGLYVDKETIGQYTGLKDIKGNRIFEGDIIVDNFFKLLPNKPHIAKYYEAYRYGLKEQLEIEIIGNIHDNPELLKEGV